MSQGNRLKYAKSPYLLQHAGNEVDWFEWSEEAFTKAKAEDKPVLLSVGYAACHWCHVFAHESFEDAGVARFMNENFISVKVDREERPDVDRVYMTYLQATNGRGGWPATYFLTPELTPIFAGTYFPKATFMSLMRQVTGMWKDEHKRKKMRASGQDVMEQLKDVSRSSPSSSRAHNAHLALEEIQAHWKKDYDSTYGGFGEEPKFPSPSLTFWPLNRFAAYTEDERKKAETISMVTHTLKCIERGGIRDHVFNGISRYSVDEKWLLPHFEKMLYDQAQLLTSALEAALLTDTLNDKIELEKMAAGIVTYLEHDLQNTGGGFFCAEDADSLPGNAETVKKEGAFYVWTYQELHQLLGDDVQLFGSHFGVKKSGNVPAKHDIQGELTGTNVLAQQSTVKETADRFRVSPAAARNIIDTCLDKLKEHRDQERPRPHLDDKILAAWNGLTISALAKVAVHPFEDRARALDIAARHAELDDINNRALQMAKSAVSFIRENLWDSESRQLHRSYREGKGPHAQADDYAFMVQGLLDLFEVTSADEYLAFAMKLQERQNELFYDEREGGYFASPVGDPYVLLRLKEVQEGAEPTAAAVSVSNLYRLAHLIDAKDNEYTEKASATVGTAGQLLQRAPYAGGTLVSNALLDEDARGIKQIIITGPTNDVKADELVKAVRSTFIPNLLLLRLSPETPLGLLAQHNEVIRSLVEGGAHEKTEARICEGRVCGLPITDVNELKAALTESI